MNLTTDTWIPIIWNDGIPDRVSLLDAFLQGDKIRDLSVRPHERIALMRLLICISQAALDGPMDRYDWQTCRDRLPRAGADYLASWTHAFELFGEGQRFLQFANVVRARESRDGDGDGNSPSKLDFSLATGNNSTLFDNAGGSARVFRPDAQALMLLVFQTFSPGGLIGDVKWDGVSMGRSSHHAPAVVKSMLHAYLTRSSLADTLHANLLTKDRIALLDRPWGRPVWEDMPAGPSSSGAVANATNSYLGRLVPVSRSIRLSRDGQDLVLGEGVRYDPDWREVAATVVVRDRDGNPERTVLSASLVKSVWREAHSVAVLATASNKMLGGPLALASLGDHQAADVWCGALAANKSKLLDTVESLLHIPAAMFADAGQQLYARGVQQADWWASRLNHAVSAFHRECNDDLDQAEFRKRGNLVKRKAASHYWTAVEQRVSSLLALVEDPAALYSESSAKANWTNTNWGKALAGNAVGAFQIACSHETPRQLKAYSLGMSALFKPVETTESASVAEETEA
ncbi:MAG: type I-E CRISPR-associated protein Cse1/CasA [Acidobacteria bacterium]|nr:type I-E CRISPR-associated protein Cse1/CasA [Acidobacteriota bacterium]